MCLPQPAGDTRTSITYISIFTDSFVGLRISHGNTGLTHISPKKIKMIKKEVNMTFFLVYHGNMH